MFIIEYIGKTGIVTTDFQQRLRLGPKPGDIVEFPDGAPYPFDRWKYGRIATLPDSEGFIEICCSGGSVHLYGPESVSISGGPFATVLADNLEITYHVKNASFWNWADNLPGAGQGVHFDLPRPVWALKSFDTKY